MRLSLLTAACGPPTVPTGLALLQESLLAALSEVHAVGRGRSTARGADLELRSFVLADACFPDEEVGLLVVRKRVFLGECNIEKGFWHPNKCLNMFVGTEMFSTNTKRLICLIAILAAQSCSAKEHQTCSSDGMVSASGQNAGAQAASNGYQGPVVVDGIITGDCPHGVCVVDSTDRQGVCGMSILPME